LTRLGFEPTQAKSQISPGCNTGRDDCNLLAPPTGDPTCQRGTCKHRVHRWLGLVLDYLILFAAQIATTKISATAISAITIITVIIF